MKRYRYRQVLLFLAVLMLPAVAILVQGRRIMAQERELTRGRTQEQLQEIGRRMAAQIGQDLLARLERIKVQEMANSPTGIPQPGRYADPEAVVLAGRLFDDRLVWPWDFEGEAGDPADPAGDAAFSGKLREAEGAEYDARDYDRAADLYREAVEIAHAAEARATARFGLARSLRRTGAGAGILAVYRELLALPWSVTDSAGIPFAYYAALAPETAAPDVLRRVMQDLDSVTVVPPGQIRSLESILESLADSAEPGVRGQARSLQARLAERVRALDEVQGLKQAQDLQREFPGLRVTDRVWRPYSGRDGELWLVGMAPQTGSSPPLVLVVRSETIRRRVESDRASGDDFIPFRVAVESHGGLPLGNDLPGLFVELDSGMETPPVVESNLEQSFYGLALLLVVPLTFVGGYVLWRDTRREVHVAEMRSQFVSSVSHELKTPLTSIRMFAEALQMRGTPDPKMQSEYLDTIVNESERLTRLLNNVLDFSRIERGQKTYRKEPSSLPEVIRAAVRTMQHPLEEQGFDLQLDIVEGLPAIALDRDAIHQAILNLLTNAMKYSGKRRDIALRLARKNGAALIEVADHGIGIPRKDQPHIFENFYRAAVPENQAISGTGLGLALVAHVARAHGGTVGVESTPGEGSTFSIRLPLDQDRAA